MQDNLVERCFSFLSQNVFPLPEGVAVTFCSTPSHLITVRRPSATGCKSSTVNETANSGGAGSNDSNGGGDGGGDGGTGVGVGLGSSGGTRVGQGHSKLTTDQAILIQVTDPIDQNRLINQFHLPCCDTKQIVYSKKGNYLALLGSHPDKSIDAFIIFNWWFDVGTCPSKKIPFISLLSLDSSHSSHFTSSFSPFSSSSAITSSPLSSDSKNSATFKPIAQCVRLSLAHFDRKAITLSACDQSGNLAISFGNLISIYRYQPGQPRPSIDRLVDIKLDLYARFVSYSNPYLSIASNNHCQLLYLQIEEEDCLSTRKKVSTTATHANSFDHRNREERAIVQERKDPQIENENIKASTLLNACSLHLPVLRNKLLLQQQHNSANNVKDENTSNNLAVHSANKSHSPEVLGPVSDQLTCGVQLQPNLELAILRCEVDVLLCRQFFNQSKSYEDEQFEIVEQDGYSQVFQKYKTTTELSMAGNRFRILQVELQPLFLSQSASHPLQDCLEFDHHQQQSTIKNSFICCNCFILLPNELIVYRSIDRSIQPVDAWNFFFDEPAKHLLLDSNVMHVTTSSSLRSYWVPFGDSFSLLNKSESEKLARQVQSNTISLLNGPVRLSHHNFLSPDKLFNNLNSVIVITLDGGKRTGYALQKPSLQQQFDESWQLLNQQQDEGKEDEKENISSQSSAKRLRFIMYLISLFKRIDFGRPCRDRSPYLRCCILLLNSLSTHFQTRTDRFRCNFFTFLLDYLDLRLFEFLEIKQSLDLRLGSDSWARLDANVVEMKNKVFVHRTGTDLSIGNEMFRQELDPTGQRMIACLQFLQQRPPVLNHVLFGLNFKSFQPLSLKLQTYIEQLDDGQFLLAKIKIWLHLQDQERVDLLMASADNNLLLDQMVALHADLLHFPQLFSTMLVHKLDLIIAFLKKTSRDSSEFLSADRFLSLVKDVRLRFVILDQLICLGPLLTNQRKLLQVLISGYIRILRQEVCDQELESEFHLKLSNKFLQTPLLNLLTPVHVEEKKESKASSTDKLEADCLQNVSNNHHFRCFCRRCCPCLSKLQYLLYVCDLEIDLKSELAIFCDQHLPSSIGWTIRILFCSFDEAITLLITHCPESIVFYCVERHSKTGIEVWQRLLLLLGDRLLMNRNDTKLMHQLLYHLSTTLELSEFARIIPSGWAEIGTHYFRIALQKHQAKQLKCELMSKAQQLRNQIMNEDHHK